MAQGPAQLGVDVQIQMAVGIVYYLIDIEMIEAQEPVGLIEPILAYQRRLLQNG